MVPPDVEMLASAPADPRAPVLGGVGSTCARLLSCHSPKVSKAGPEAPRELKRQGEEPSRAGQGWNLAPKEA